MESSHTLLARLEIRKSLSTSVLKMGKRGKKAAGGGKALAPPTHYVPGSYGPRQKLSRVEEARLGEPDSSGFGPKAS